MPIQVPGTVLRLRRELAWQLAALCVDGMLFFSALSIVLWNGGDPVFWKEQISPLVRRVGSRGGGGVGMGVSDMVFVGLVLGCIEAKFCK